jgi:hypothetical protein
VVVVRFQRAVSFDFARREAAIGRHCARARKHCAGPKMVPDSAYLIRFGGPEDDKPDGCVSFTLPSHENVCAISGGLHPAAAFAAKSLLARESRETWYG